MKDIIDKLRDLDIPFQSLTIRRFDKRCKADLDEYSRQARSARIGVNGPVPGHTTIIYRAPDRHDSNFLWCVFWK